MGFILRLINKYIFLENIPKNKTKSDKQKIYRTSIVKKRNEIELTRNGSYSSDCRS